MLKSRGEEKELEEFGAEAGSQGIGKRAKWPGPGRHTKLRQTPKSPGGWANLKKRLCESGMKRWKDGRRLLG